MKDSYYQSMLRVYERNFSHSPQNRCNWTKTSISLFSIPFSDKLSQYLGLQFSGKFSKFPLKQFSPNNFYRTLPQAIGIITTVKCILFSCEGMNTFSFHPAKVYSADLKPILLFPSLSSCVTFIAYLNFSTSD